MNAAAVPNADPIVAPAIRNLDRLARQLEKWLEPRLHVSDLRVDNLAYPRGAGRSHETILFDARWLEGASERSRGLVVRIKPSTTPVYLDDMFDEQFALMELLSREGSVRVAETMWIEHNRSILGAPFFIMEKRDGRVPITVPSYAQTGWLYEASPAQRRVLWEDSVRQLAAIQKVPTSRVPFLDRGTPEGGFAQELDRWARYLDWLGQREPVPFHRKVFDHLVENLPGNRPEGIVWGDARIGNMMFADDFSVVAVMDWEQTSLGGALHDLGWWLYSEYLRTTAIGAPTLEGMGEREETIALWEEVTAISAADIDWYILFAAFKMSCLGSKMLGDGRRDAGKADIHDTDINRDLARRLGWPGPNI